MKLGVQKSICTAISHFVPRRKQEFREHIRFPQGRHFAMAGDPHKLNVYQGTNLLKHGLGTGGQQRALKKRNGSRTVANNKWLTPLVVHFWGPNFLWVNQALGVFTLGEGTSSGAQDLHLT